MQRLSTTSLNRAAFIACGVLCALSGLGCPPGPSVTVGPQAQPLRPTNDIIRVVRENAALLDRSLWSQSVTVKARFKDDKEKEHVYNLEGSLLFRQPRDLRMDLRPGLGDQVMQVGSNAEDFWIWVEPEIKAMHWGRHRHIGKPCAGKIAVRPDQMVSALGFGGLPPSDTPLIGPARKFGKQLDILYYLRPGAEGGFVLDREYWVERSSPFMVRFVLFRDDFGRVTTSALLDDYRSAWEGGPLLPHMISLIWPQDEGKFTVYFDQLRGLEADKVNDRAFVRPERESLPNGIVDVIQTDHACDEIEAVGDGDLPEN